MHCEVNQRHIRRSEPTREAALKYACSQLLQGHAVNRIVGPNKTIPLNWPAHLPDTRRALAAAEWTRRHQPRAFPQFHKDLFAAHFVLGEDLEDSTVIDRHASGAGVDLDALHAALADGSAAAGVDEAETTGRKYGVQGTPAWLLAQRLITGLLPAEEFESLADQAMRLSG